MGSTTPGGNASSTRRARGRPAGHLPRSGRRRAPKPSGLPRKKGVADQIDADDRAFFILHEIEELPMKQIAAALGYPMQTGYFRLYRERRHVERAFRALAKESHGG